jgi:ADP-ribose pyrophosphatase
VTLEIPAGKVDPGETAEQCAKRELLEETGYEAASVRCLYTYAPAIGYSSELIHIFEARGLSRRSERLDEVEIDSLEILHLDEVRALIREGRILDGKTLIGLFLLGITI